MSSPLPLDPSLPEPLARREFLRMLGAAGAATLSFFDQAPAAAATPAAATTASPDERRVTVVQRKLSAFVVQIDYLSLPEEKAPAGTEGEPKK
jgi:hypothetical protein